MYRSHCGAGSCDKALLMVSNGADIRRALATTSICWQLSWYFFSHKLTPGPPRFRTMLCMVSSAWRLDAKCAVSRKSLNSSLFRCHLLGLRQKRTNSFNWSFRDLLALLGSLLQKIVSSASSSSIRAEILGTPVREKNWQSRFIKEVICSVGSHWRKLLTSSAGGMP